MLVYAGIDEAGYGPMLGPLCIGSAVFVLDDYRPEDGAPNLWRLLGKAVCRKRRDSRQRIAIDDSKRLKGQSTSKTHPLRHLERGVLSFAAAAGTDADSDAMLLNTLGRPLPNEPWYDSVTALPVAHDPDQIRIAAARLRRTLESAGVGSCRLACEVIDVGRFNERVDRIGNKASVNLEGIFRLLEAVWTQHAEHHPRVIVDRQSGRMHYREELQRAWPDASIRIIAESETLSRYRLVRQGCPLTVSFMREAESHHLPVALASMVAKYVRELGMLRLNRYFQERVPGLRPTAGYVTDARRYLKDIAGVADDLARSSLIRTV